MHTIAAGIIRQNELRAEYERNQKAYTMPHAADYIIQDEDLNMIADFSRLCFDGASTEQIDEAWKNAIWLAAWTAKDLGMIEVGQWIANEDTAEITLNTNGKTYSGKTASAALTNADCEGFMLTAIAYDNPVAEYIHTAAVFFIAKEDIFRFLSYANSLETANSARLVVAA